MLQNISFQVPAGNISIEQEIKRSRFITSIGRATDKHRNYGSNKTLTMECYQGTEGKTLTGQDNTIPVYLPSTAALTLISFATVGCPDQSAGNTAFDHGWRFPLTTALYRSTSANFVCCRLKTGCPQIGAG